MPNFCSSCSKQSSKQRSRLASCSSLLLKLKPTTATKGYSSIPTSALTLPLALGRRSERKQEATFSELTAKLRTSASKTTASRTTATVEPNSKTSKGLRRLPQLTQMEFNTIRELVGPALTNKVKFQTYAQNVQDPQLKQVF